MPQAPKSPSNVASTFFSPVHLLPKHLTFEHGGAKSFLAPGVILPLYAPGYEETSVTVEFYSFFETRKEHGTSHLLPQKSSEHCFCQNLVTIQIFSAVKYLLKFSVWYPGLPLFARMTRDQ